ncbi:hypothetical protein SSX86_026025 [Deinandra increscens subsp. villosa]|uniref:EGF-like domain-containing protein n=1 Tax=Deinandra increscens subsp. villosa TaxID=3103831 RepID=A0AAP0GMQ7_9ASTR
MELKKRGVTNVFLKSTHEKECENDFNKKEDVETDNPIKVGQWYDVPSIPKSKTETENDSVEIIEASHHFKTSDFNGVTNVFLKSTDEKECENDFKKKEDVKTDNPIKVGQWYDVPSILKSKAETENDSVEIIEASHHFSPYKSHIAREISDELRANERDDKRLKNLMNWNWDDTIDLCSSESDRDITDLTLSRENELSDTTDSLENYKSEAPDVIIKVGNMSCSDARSGGVLACQANSQCVESDTEIPGYKCICNSGYQGEPYLEPGCQDINECDDPSNNLCVGVCTNTPGNYTCRCKDGYKGDGLKNGRGCTNENPQFPIIKFSLGKKPLCMERPEEERNLAAYFILSLKENRLFQILEPRVVREGTLEQLQQIGELVKRCVNLEGDERPTMKEVAIELEGLCKFTQHPWASQQGDEENANLLDEEETDLYEESINPYSSTGEISSCFSIESGLGYPSNILR